MSSFTSHVINFSAESFNNFAENLSTKVSHLRSITPGWHFL